MVAAATPGLEHLLVLGKIKELERDRVADLIVVDAPPAGHAAPFLRSASGLRAGVASGPVRDQADEVCEMLADPARTQALLVTLAEETPVNEVIELAYDVEEELGIALAPVVINACWPDRQALSMSVTAAAATAHRGYRLAIGAHSRMSAPFGAARLQVQREQIVDSAHASPSGRFDCPAFRLAPPRPSTISRCWRMSLASRSVHRPDRMTTTLGGLIANTNLLVTCGPGGVGKTTTAAAIGLAAARLGRRVVVVTIDPARRLADALGITEPTAEPHLVAGATHGSQVRGGSLSALMLDAERTFDRLIIDSAGDRAGQQCLANPIYRGIAGSLGGRRNTWQWNDCMNSPRATSTT